MPAGPPSSSSRTAALFVLAAVLGISGCAARNAMVSELNGGPPLRLNTIDETTAAAAAANPPQPRRQTAAETPATADIVAVPAAERKSAWCEYLAEDAAADATILRAPTLGGQVDDEGKGAVNLSLSMSGLRKAQLIEQSAEARCRRHLAESGLQKVVFLAPQDLSSAGYRSKAEVIDRNAGDLEKLRRRIAKEVAAGNLTAGQAANLTTMIDGLLAAAAEARSQAARRKNDGLALTGPAAEYSALLLRAESDLEDLNSKIRSTDAFDVSVEAGYSDIEVTDGYDSVPEGVNAKIKLSLKLGAFAPDRYKHEERAKAAKLAAIRDQEGGALWQIRALREAHVRAINGLEESEQRIDRAIAETRKFVSLVQSATAPEMAGASIEAQLRLIGLQSDKAAVAGSIAEIRAKLKQLAPG